METFYLAVTYILVGLVGLCVGSFLNVVIYRLPEGMSLVKPKSHCTKCNYELKWYDNIPVLSYIILGGKCRNCKAHISFRYTAVELANMLLWLLSALLFWKQNIALSIIYMAVISVFICVFFIDLEHKIIFDRFQIILLCLGVACIFLDKSVSWYSHLIGGVAGFAVFFLLAFLFEKIVKREGLGGGDVKLSGVSGLILGWEKLLLSLLIASLLAVIVIAIFSKSKDEKNREFPFAPFLTVGFTAAMLFGSRIISWYLSLFGI